MPYGVRTARRGWVPKASVLNTRTAAELKKWIAKKQKA